jgi:hypothetical protein
MEMAIPVAVAESIIVRTIKSLCRQNIGGELGSTG